MQPHHASEDKKSEEPEWWSTWSLSSWERLFRPWWVKVLSGIFMLAMTPFLHEELTQLDNGQRQPRKFRHPSDGMDLIYTWIGKWPTILLAGGAGVSFIGQGLWQFRNGKRKMQTEAAVNAPNRGMADNSSTIRAGQRVRVLSGACRSMCGIVDTVEDDRRVANVIIEHPWILDHPWTSEEDFTNLEVLPVNAPASTQDASSESN